MLLRTGFLYVSKNPPVMPALQKLSYEYKNTYCWYNV